MLQVHSFEIHFPKPKHHVFPQSVNTSHKLFTPQDLQGTLSKGIAKIKIQKYSICKLTHIRLRQDKNT